MLLELQALDGHGYSRLFSVASPKYAAASLNPGLSCFTVRGAPGRVGAGDLSEEY